MKTNEPISTRETLQESDRQWFCTERAAAYLDMSVKALLMQVSRGKIVPDVFGQRGRTRSHRFSRQTLDAFARGNKAA